MVTARPGTPTAVRICSTRASKPAGGSARATPARHHTAAAHVTAVHRRCFIGGPILRTPDPRADRHADRPRPGQAQPERTVGQRAGRADRGDAQVVRQVLAEELEGPPPEVGTRTKVQAHEAVRLADAAVGGAAVELDGP